MAAGRVQTLYTQKAKLYQLFFVDLLQWGNVLRAFFQEKVDFHAEMKILDAGCGTGIVTRSLYELAHCQRHGVFTFHAFDLTPAMLDLFRQWMDHEGIQDIELQQADALDLDRQLPQDWKDYDLIVSSAMLEYIPKEKLSQVLTNLKSLLHREGALLLLVTRQTGITRWLAAKWWHTNLFDYEELKAELRQAGFTAIQKEKLPGYWGSFILAIEARLI